MGDTLSMCCVERKGAPAVVVDMLARMVLDKMEQLAGRSLYGPSCDAA